MSLAEIEKNKRQALEKLRDKLAGVDSFGELIHVLEGYYRWHGNPAQDLSNALASYLAKDAEPSKRIEVKLY
jgi:hypothetical protein